MSDVGTGIFAKGRVVPEDVVALSVFPFACFGWFVLQGVVVSTFSVVVSTFIECFQYQHRTQIPRPSRQALSQRSQAQKNLQPKHHQDQL